MKHLYESILDIEAPDDPTYEMVYRHHNITIECVRDTLLKLYGDWVKYGSNKASQEYIREELDPIVEYVMRQPVQKLAVNRIREFTKFYGSRSGNAIAVWFQEKEVKVRWYKNYLIRIAFY